MAGMSVPQAVRLLAEHGRKATVRGDGVSYNLIYEGQTQVVSGEQLLEVAAKAEAVAHAIEVFKDTQGRTVTYKGKGLYLGVRDRDGDAQHWTEDELITAAANMEKKVKTLFKNLGKSGGNGGKDKADPAPPSPPTDQPAPPAEASPSPPALPPAPQGETPSTPEPGALVHLPDVDPELMRITVEIRASTRRMASEASVAGALLIEAKKIVGHGHWGLYVRSQLGMTERTAQNLMRIAQATVSVPNAHALADLEATKVLQLLEAFGDEGAAEAAQELDAANHSTRELDAEIKRRQDAERRAADAAEEARLAREAVDHAMTAGDKLKERIKELQSQPAPEGQVVERTVPDPAQAALIAQLQGEIQTRETTIANLEAKRSKDRVDIEALQQERDQLKEDRATLERTVATTGADKAIIQRSKEVVRYLDRFRGGLLEAAQPLEILLIPDIGHHLDAAGARDLADVMIRLANRIKNCLPQ